MIDINVLLFASVREHFSHSNMKLKVNVGYTAGDVWRNINGSQDFKGPVLCSVNQVISQMDAKLADGDEVGFFPPVTGG